MEKQSVEEIEDGFEETTCSYNTTSGEDEIQTILGSVLSLSIDNSDSRCFEFAEKMFRSKNFENNAKEPVAGCSGITSTPKLSHKSQTAFGPSSFGGRFTLKPLFNFDSDEDDDVDYEIIDARNEVVFGVDKESAFGVDKKALAARFARGLQVQIEKNVLKAPVAQKLEANAKIKELHCEQAQQEQVAAESTDLAKRLILKAKRIVKKPE